MENISLSQLLKKHGFFFKKKFGQNFISDKNLLSDIVEKSAVDKDGTVIEIGAGAGTLTRELAKSARRVISFEIDKSLEGVLSDMTQDLQNIEFIFADFMRYSMDELENKINGGYIVVANLPYYITTPVIMRFIEESKNCDKIAVMVQKEVAQRFCAKENTAEYGAVTAVIALEHSARIIKTVPRRAFYPVPNVDSAVVEITKERGKHTFLSLDMYKLTVKCAFLNRRKTLANNLMSFFGLTRKQAENALTNCGIDFLARGETLSVKDFIKLSDFLFENFKNSLAARTSALKQ